MPLLLSSPPEVRPPQPFSGSLTREPSAVVWHQRPPVGWTAVSSEACSPTKALRGLAVTKQFRTSPLFLLERGQGGNKGASCSHQRFPASPNFTLSTFQTLRTRHKAKLGTPTLLTQNIEDPQGAPARPSKDVNC